MGEGKNAPRLSFEPFRLLPLAGDCHEIKCVMLIIADSERHVATFPKASFNIALTFARTKALYTLAWNGVGSACSSVPCNVAYAGYMYVCVCICVCVCVRECAYGQYISFLYGALLLPVILTVPYPCRTFAFAVQCCRV